MLILLRKLHLIPILFSIKETEEYYYNRNTFRPLNKLKLRNGDKYKGRKLLNQAKVK